MPTLTLKPDTHVKLRYPMPERGVIRFFVEADIPVTTYVFDEQELREFYKSKNEFDSHGGFAYRRRHQQRLKLDFSGWWYLVIMNDSNTEPAAVYYEVSY